MSEDAINRLYSQNNASSELNVPQHAVHEMSFSENNETAPVSNIPRKFRFLPKKWHKILAGVLVIVLLLASTVGALGFYIFTVAMQMQQQSNDIQATATATYDKFKSQNLPATEEGIKVIAQKVTNLRSTYNKLSFLNAIPLANSYYQDGIHGFNSADSGISAALKSIHAVAPYADVLGFKGQGSFTGGTAEDRLKNLLVTLQKVTPELDNIGKDLSVVQKELSAIDPNRYPETFMGKHIRSKIVEYQTLSSSVTLALVEFKPVIEQLPQAAGADGKRRKYFMLFQNDNELRPTGGFLTAFSIINVDGGKVSPEKSDDIYELDKKFNKNLPIPEILGRYLTTEKYWHLRDMNTAPDFKNSMTQFLTNYQLVPDEPHDIDGVVAVDTRVLTDLLRLVGPINIDGYGKFSAENEPKCNCPQIIYALSEIADRPVNYVKVNRKGILGPLMHELLLRVYSAPKVLWPKLFELAWQNIQSRHAQMYFYDQKLQAAAEKVGAAGVMQSDSTAQDFMAVIDANLGGAKSNLFTSSEITQQVSAPSNGVITKKVSITYKNSRGGDNCNLEAGLLCLNAAMPDWNRIYLPKGSKLVNSQGYKANTVKQYDEANFTIIDGTFTLEPKSTSKINIEYTVPYTDSKIYRVKLWKQGGVVSVPVLMDVNGNQDKLTLDKDLVYEAKF